MIEIQGAYNSAIVYTENLEELARSQIQSVCDQEVFAGCKLRIMPDVHAGKGCTIGTTMTIRDKIVPGMVGVDIGCGMETIRIAEKSMDFDRLDQLIRTNIPFGRNTRKKPHPYAEQVPLDALKCSAHVNLSRARCSVGTLGGGNHFIEVDRGQDGSYYLVVHSEAGILDYKQPTGTRQKASRRFAAAPCRTLTPSLHSSRPRDVTGKFSPPSRP